MDPIGGIVSVFSSIFGGVTASKVEKERTNQIIEAGLAQDRSNAAQATIAAGQSLSKMRMARTGILIATIASGAAIAIVYMVMRPESMPRRAKSGKYEKAN